MAVQEKSMASKKLQKSYFDVVGLCCSSEVPLIENILKPLEGVKEISVIVPTRTVIVVHDNLLISQLQIVKALNQARLEANVRAYGEPNFKKKWPSPYAVSSGLLLALSFLKYVYPPFQWLALAAVVVGILPIILKGFTSLRNFRLDTNILVLIAVLGTIAMKDYVEAGVIVFLFTIAEWLESRASHKASAVMSSLMSIAPQKAVIAETGEVVEVDEVKLNTILAVKAGEVIPIDGIVVDGKCEVDEKTLTGESFPVTKQMDSTVWAGTINLNGYITVKTSSLAEDCVVAKMAKLVEEAQNSKSRTQRFIDKCAQYYTPAVIIISTCLAVIPVAVGVHNRNHWFHLALVVLVSACPCALILSTPVATFCALTKAATSGLLIKGGDYLEILAKIKVMAFDKTGTITRGEFVVTDFRSLREDISLNKLLYWVSSIESKSSHPMATTLVDHGRSLSIEPKPDDVEEFQNFPGEGIYGKIDGKDIYIGNRKIALKAGCETVPTLEGDTKGGKTIGYIFSGATPAGIFNLSDACRSGAAEAIKELKLLGIKTAMLTGDNEAAAMHAQEQLGQALEVVHAELLPKDKARILEAFKKDGPTAMIGDGLNDAPALATADIGISMGISGSALATETGNVILMSNDLRKVPKAIQLARKAHRKVIENVILSISTKVAILALAVAGHPLVWAAVLADVGTCLLVIFNSMLILRGTHKHGGKCCKSKAASHTHEHECNTKNSHSSHNHKHCYSNPKAQKVCQPKKCSSLNSCGNNKCTESAKKHDGCVGSDGLHEAKHCGHGSCGMVNQEMGSHNTHHNHGDCEVKCSNSMKRQGDCEEGDGIHEVNHCEHGSCNMVTDHDMVSHNTCNHLNHSTLEHGHQMSNNGHCHDKNHINHEALEHATNSGCNDHHDHHHHQSPEDHHHHHQSPDVHPKLRECCTDLTGPHHTIIAIPLDAHHVESETMHACMSLEKSEIGGCCRSYMKECCKHGHFGAGFGGGLTEIVTE